MIAAFLGEYTASHSGARLMGGKDYQSQCDWMTPIGNFYSNIRFASLLVPQRLTDKGQESLRK
jgi:hypothetical protein